MHDRLVIAIVILDVLAITCSIIAIRSTLKQRRRWSQLSTDLDAALASLQRPERDA